MLKSLRKQLLKIRAIERRVADYCKRLKWARIMYTGGNVHNLKTEKSDSVFPVRADGGMYEGMRDGKVVRRGLIDVRNWGNIKI